MHSLDSHQSIDKTRIYIDTFASDPLPSLLVMFHILLLLQDYLEKKKEEDDAKKVELRPVITPKTGTPWQKTEGQPKVAS